MKRILIGAFLLIGHAVYAQNIPISTSTLPTAIPVAVPAAYSTGVINYVRTWTPSMPIADTNVVKATVRTVAEVKMSTVYVDGLGRNLQTVAKGISPLGNDLVQSVTYDPYGREQYKYLPYVQQSGNANDGNFKKDPFSSQQAFYQNSSLNPGIAGESIYYGNTVYETSPLSRVVSVAAPGNSWSNKPAKLYYYLNDVTDSVRIWNVEDNVPVNAGIYASGTLRKNVTVDEDGLQTVEYKDKGDRIILTKRLSAGAVSSAHSGWLCTYYIYDDLGRLACVFPPIATDVIMRRGWDLSGDILDELCFMYQYDERDRVVVKRVPGVGPLYMVYDNRDRLIFTQDAVQRRATPQEWLAYFYDDLNRISRTGIYKERNSVGEVPDSSGVKLPVDLVLNSYDGTTTNYAATNSITLMPGFETLSGISVIMEIPGIDRTVNITSPVLPIDEGALTALTYTYYDNYNYNGTQGYVSADITKPQSGDNPYAEALSSSPSAMTQGLITGIKKRVLGTEQFLMTSSYYDDKGRMIQTTADNHAGGKDVATNLYDFNGKLLSSYARLQNPHSTLTPQLTVLTMHAYDAGGRLISVTKRLNDDPAQDQILATNSYDELGQLRQKRLGVTGDTQLDSVTYTYNIRGWLSGINKAYVNSGSTNNYFGEELSYDYGFTKNQYGGNIAGVKWKGANDGVARAYGFQYDNINRLTGADFRQRVGAEQWNNSTVDFSVSNLAYDGNGNIMSMKQEGMVGVNKGTIDNLTYRYATNSNKLMAVTDAVNNTEKSGDFKDGNKDGDDYGYNANGSMVSDRNKGITSISYNHLQLPDTLRIKGKGSIIYQYEATGVKLKKTVIDSMVSPVKITVSDYVGGGLYQQDTLQYIAHEEGRIRPKYDSGKAVKFVYDYFEKDHLGNIRVVLGTERDTSVYLATMETSAGAKENALFSNVDNTRFQISAITNGYPSDAVTDPNKFVAKVSAEGEKIGPSLVLRVMAGDTVQIHTSVAYNSAAANVSNTSPDQLMAAVLQAFMGTSVIEGAHSAAVTNAAAQSVFNKSNYEAIKRDDAENNATDKPKAYLNYVMFDDQLKMVSENSGIRQPQDGPGVLNQLDVNPMRINKSGFIYIYVSNESQEPVYFDNLTVVHASGPLLEETHYYPYGLTMSGISANVIKGTNYLKNKKEYNGIEHTTDFNLNQYEAFYRTLDPQIGRWWQIDPKPKDYESPYVSMDNNPNRYSDLLGDTIVNNDGSKVSYKLIDGSIKWSDNASADIMRIGNSMAQSEAGLIVLDAMSNAKHPIKMTINKTDDMYFDGTKPTTKKEEAKLLLFGWTENHRENDKLVSSEITIYEKNLEKLDNAKIKGKTIEKDFDGTKVTLTNYTIDQHIGANGVHEGVHATDKKSMTVFNKTGGTEVNPRNQELNYYNQVKK